MNVDLRSVALGNHSCPLFLCVFVLLFDTATPQSLHVYGENAYLTVSSKANLIQHT